MINQVLDTYLDSIRNEREFDTPFMSLLTEMGFYDVHFTHDMYEFAKDFIGKLESDGKVIQYIFQSKAKDVNLQTWRTEIEPQLREALTNTLSHPNFNPHIARQVVFVSTGDFVGGAKLASQDWNNNFVPGMGSNSVQFWCKPQLKTLLEQHGLTGIYRATAQGYASHAEFFRIYSQCLLGKLSEREIERYSCYWLDLSLPTNKRVLRATLESEILARQLIEEDFLYEAIYVQLAATRVLLHASYSTNASNELEMLRKLYILSLDKLRTYCESYIDAIRALWEKSGKDLVAAGFNGMFTYLVHTCRILEIAGLLYLLVKDQALQSSIMEFIIDLYSVEPSVGRIPSDSYAVSLVLPVIVAKHSGRDDFAKKILDKTSRWLADRVQNGSSIAGFDATESEEVNTLLGGQFPSLGKRSGGGFLKTALIDLAAFLGDSDTYHQTFSTLQRTVFPTYWQVHDSIGITVLEGSDIIEYPNFQIFDSIAKLGNFGYAEHIKNELRNFSVGDVFGTFSLVILMLLLRDRYFPTVWSQVLAEATSLEADDG